MAAFVDSLVNDLRSVNSYLESMMNGNQSRNDVLEVQLQAMKNRMSVLAGVSIADATRVANAVNLGPWSPAQKRILMDAVNNCQTRAPGPVPRKRLQSCLHFEQYQTEREWNALTGPAMRASKINQMAARAWSIGLTNPSEPTSFRMAAIIVHCEGVLVFCKIVASTR